MKEFIRTSTGRTCNQRSLFGKIGAHKDFHLVPGPTVQKEIDFRLGWLSSKFKTGIFALWAGETGLWNTLTILKKKLYKLCMEGLGRTWFSIMSRWGQVCAVQEQVGMICSLTTPFTTLSVCPGGQHIQACALHLENWLQHTTRLSGHMEKIHKDRQVKPSSWAEELLALLTRIWDVLHVAKRFFSLLFPSGP